MKKGISIMDDGDLNIDTIIGLKRPSDINTDDIDALVTSTKNTSLEKCFQLFRVIPQMLAPSTDNVKYYTDTMTHMVTGDGSIYVEYISDNQGIRAKIACNLHGDLVFSVNATTSVIRDQCVHVSNIPVYTYEIKNIGQYDKTGDLSRIVKFINTVLNMYDLV